MTSSKDNGKSPAPRKGLFLLVGLFSSVACWNYQEEFNFRKKLLSDYNKYMRPLKDMGDAVEVDVHISFVSTRKFNIVNGQVIIEAYATLGWHDQILPWNVSSYNISEILIKGIWTPVFDLDFGGKQLNYKKNQPVSIDYKGNVIKWDDLSFEIHCEINAYAYPFDKHLCKKEIYFKDYDVQKLRFRSLTCEEFIDPVISNWIVSKSCSIFHKFNYSAGFLKISFHRNAPVKCFSIFLPLFIFFILNMMVGYLPVESGEKVTFATTVFLANVVYLEEVSKQLPTEPTSIPLLFWSHLILIFLSGMSAVGTIITSKIFWRAESPGMTQLYKNQAKTTFEYTENNNPGDNCKDADIGKAGRTRKDDKNMKHRSYHRKIELVMFKMMIFISVIYAFVMTSLFVVSIFEENDF